MDGMDEQLKLAMKTAYMLGVKDFMQMSSVDRMQQVVDTVRRYADETFNQIMKDGNIEMSESDREAMIRMMRKWCWVAITPVIYNELLDDAMPDIASKLSEAKNGY